ncbi:MAG: TolC family protein [Desulfobacterales bacterium]|nr:TolC family protein [Desulfobacterales bacterium]
MNYQINIGGRMRRLLTIAGFFCLVQFFLSGSALADIDFSTYQELSCETFMADAMDKDPEFLGALQIYLGAKYDKLSAKSIAAWTLGALGGIERFLSVSGSNNIQNRTDSYFYEVSLEKLFLTTGTRFKVSHGNAISEMKYNGYTAFVHPLLPPYDVPSITGEMSSPSVTISVIQPLVKNAFGLADRFPVKVADLQVKSAELDVKEAWENRISDLYDAYLLWIGAYENTVALQEIVSDLKRMEKQIRRKVSAKVSERTDLLLTRETVLNYQGKLIQAEGDFINSTINITSLRLGRPVTSKDISKIRPGPCRIGFQSENDMSNGRTVDVSQLRLVRQLGFLGKQLEESIRVAKNDRLPSIDAVGEYTKKARSDDRSGGYSELENDNREDYMAMLQFKYPIGSQKARGDLGKAKADLAEVEASIKSTRQSLSLALQQMKENISRMEEVLELLDERVKNAEEKLNLDTKNYKIGRLDTRYLIDSRNTLTNVRLQKVQTEIQLNQLYVDYLSTADKMLKRFPDIIKKLKVEQGD